MTTEEDDKLELDDGGMYDEIKRDTVHMLCHQILESGGKEDASKTLERYNLLKHLSDSILDDIENRKEGEIYIRTRLANAYVVSCIENPYGSLDNVDCEELDVLAPLYRFSRGQWEKFEKTFTRLRKIMMGPEDEDSSLYTTKFRKVVQLIRLQQAVSGFRETLEEQFRTKQDETATVDTAVLKEFAELVETQEDEMIKEVLENLMVHNDGTSGKTRASGISLQNIGQLRNQFSVKPFDLAILQSKIRYLLVGWMNDYFKTPPILVQLGYSELLGLPKENMEQEAKMVAQEEDEEDEEEEQFLATQPPIGNEMMTQDGEEISEVDEEDDRKPAAKMTPAAASELRDLQTARDNLRRDAEDPLAECVEIASKAVRIKQGTPGSTGKRTTPARRTPGSTGRTPGSKRKRGKLYGKRKTAHKIAFSPDGDEESEGDEGQPTLNAVPRAAKMRTASPQKQKKIVVRRMTNSDGTRKRRRFTQVEKIAIREGVRKFGFGKWAKIKEEYSEILRERTNVNIKDCYRTMMNNDEV